MRRDELPAKGLNYFNKEVLPKLIEWSIEQSKSTAIERPSTLTDKNVRDLASEFKGFAANKENIIKLMSAMILSKYLEVLSEIKKDASKKDALGEIIEKQANTIVNIILSHPDTVIANLFNSAFKLIAIRANTIITPQPQESKEDYAQAGDMSDRPARPALAPKPATQRAEAKHTDLYNQAVNNFDTKIVDTVLYWSIRQTVADATDSPSQLTDDNAQRAANLLNKLTAAEKERFVTETSAKLLDKYLRIYSDLNEHNKHSKVKAAIEGILKDIIEKSTQPEKVDASFMNTRFTIISRIVKSINYTRDLDTIAQPLNLDNIQFERLDPNAVARYERKYQEIAGKQDIATEDEDEDIVLTPNPLAHPSASSSSDIETIRSPQTTSFTRLEEEEEEKEEEEEEEEEEEFDDSLTVATSDAEVPAPPPEMIVTRPLSLDISVDWNIHNNFINKENSSYVYNSKDKIQYEKTIIAARLAVSPEGRDVGVLDSVNKKQLTTLATMYGNILSQLAQAQTESNNFVNDDGENTVELMIDGQYVDLSKLVSLGKELSQELKTKLDAQSITSLDYNIALAENRVLKAFGQSEQALPLIEHKVKPKDFNHEIVTDKKTTKAIAHARKLITACNKYFEISSNIDNTISQGDKKCMQANLAYLKDEIEELQNICIQNYAKKGVTKIILDAMKDSSSNSNPAFLASAKQIFEQGEKNGLKKRKFYSNLFGGRETSATKFKKMLEKQASELSESQTDYDRAMQDYVGIIKDTQPQQEKYQDTVSLIDDDMTDDIPSVTSDFDDDASIASNPCVTQEIEDTTSLDEDARSYTPTLDYQRDEDKQHKLSAEVKPNANKTAVSTSFSAEDTRQALSSSKGKLDLAKHTIEQHKANTTKDNNMTIKKCNKVLDVETLASFVALQKELGINVYFSRGVINASREQYSHTKSMQEFAAEIKGIALKIVQQNDLAKPAHMHEKRTKSQRR